MSICEAVTGGDGGVRRWKARAEPVDYRPLGSGTSSATLISAIITAIQLTIFNLAIGIWHRG